MNIDYDSLALMGQLLSFGNRFLQVVLELLKHWHEAKKSRPSQPRKPGVGSAATLHSPVAVERIALTPARRPADLRILRRWRPTSAALPALLAVSGTRSQSK